MTSREPIRLSRPRSDAHVASSMMTIQDAIDLAQPPRRAALVLGAGRAREIPVDRLCAAFARVDFVDIDPVALRDLARRLGATGAIARFHQADITGLIDPLSARARDLVQAEPAHAAHLPRLVELLRRARPDFWRPADDPLSHDLVVCSGVLTQLQAGVRDAIERAVARDHARSAAALSSAPAWRAAAMDFARALEAAFVRHLDRALATPGGVVYLADTVTMSWLTEDDADTLTTPGHWLATRTARLADYLDPSDELLIERSWPWFRHGPEGRYWGRLYGVQANVYRPSAGGAEHG